MHSFTLRFIAFFLLSFIHVATAADDDGFVPLFNGENLEGWFVSPEVPASPWKVQKGGVLARQSSSSYVWTKETFDDFVLELEFKLSPGCNSGVFFRTDPENPVQGGFEIQIFDSFEQETDKHHLGAFYDARPPLVNAAKPAGEWNTFKLHVQGSKVVIHINDQKVQDLDINDWDTAGKNPDGTDNKFKTALKDLPRTGHIGLQDHGHNVFYRNIRVKRL